MTHMTKKTFRPFFGSLNSFILCNRIQIKLIFTFLVRAFLADLLNDHTAAGVQSVKMRPLVGRHATSCVLAVSYTHLDVYKRQDQISVNTILSYAILRTFKRAYRRKKLNIIK